MPKEVVRENHKKNAATAEVRWSNVFPGMATLSIDRGEKFSFHGETTWYTSLVFGFNSADEIDQLIKHLKKARRKAFNR